MLKIKAAARNAAVLGSSCFFAYAGCYMGRNILSSMLPQMVDSGVYGRDALASMGSAFFITYGIGQLINGLIGNKVRAKLMVFIGLFFSGTMLVLFPLLYWYPLALFLWAVCGFLCSMLWGPLSRLVGENTTAQVGRILLTLLTIASVVGTAVTYFLAILSALKGSWKSGFFITGTVLILLSILWFIANAFMENRGIVKKESAPCKTEKKGNPISFLLKNGIIAITVITMLNGVIRNAVAFWIPTFISERFSVSAASAAEISAVLPFVNIAGTLLSVLGAKLFHNNEHKMLTVLFAFTTLMFTAMYFLNGKGMILNLAALFAASAAMTGACNMIFSYYVLRFADTGKISGVTGFLDFSSYISASAASLLFSFLVPKCGWNFIVGLWGGITLAGLFVSLLSKRRSTAS